MNVSIEANNVDPDQVWSGSTLFDQKALKHFSRRQKQATFVVIGVLDKDYFWTRVFVEQGRSYKERMLYK